MDSNQLAALLVLPLLSALMGVLWLVGKISKTRIINFTLKAFGVSLTIKMCGRSERECSDIMHRSDQLNAE